MRRWYAVETLPASETRAVTNVERQNFTCFYPKLERSKVRYGQLRIRIEPLFPRYFFVRLDLDQDQWRCINNSYGVKRLVQTAGLRPQPLPDTTIDTLQARCVGGVIRPDTGSLRIGDSVRVTRGPFQDALATIDRFESGQRVRILMELLTGVVPVTLAASALESAPA